MEENLYTQIEDYLDGTLEAGDRQDFEAKLQADPALAQALETVREARQRLQALWSQQAADEALTATLQATGSRFFKSGGTAAKPGGSGAKVVQLSRTWWAAAAAIALLLIGWLFLRPPAEERLYAQYRNFPEAAFSLRNNDPGQSTLQNAAAAFNEKNYASALEQLQLQLKTDPENLEARFFSGLCWLELKNYSAATAVFLPISNNANAWADEARWYLALSYLRQNQRDKCAEVLRQIPNGSGHFAEAQDLLAKINS